MIEVWRPHRQNVHNRRPQHDRNKVAGRRERGPSHAPAQAVPVEGAAVEGAADGPRAETRDARPDRSARPRRPEGEGFRRPAGGGAKGGDRSGGPGGGGPNRRDGRPSREGRPAEGRRGREDHRDGSGGFRRDDRAPSVQSSEKPKPRDRAPDPNSPFAKLAALKEQMEKDRR